MTRTLILVASLGLLACDGAGPSASGDRIDDILALETNTTDGEASYAQLCETCHAADGTGGGAFPDLTAFVGDESQRDFIENMIEGPGSMPTFDTQDDVVLANITAYAYASF